MRTPQSKNINGTEYTVQLLPPTQALDLLVDLAQMLGPALDPILSNLGTLQGLLDKDLADVDTAFFGQAARALCSSTDKVKLRAVVKLLGDVTLVNGAQLSRVHEAHFLERGLGEMFLWLPFALEVQYGDFFAVLGSAVQRAPRHAAPVV